MRVLFAGTPEIALPSLRAVAQVHEVAAVLTAPDRPVGRGRKLQASPVAEHATELGVPVLRFEKLNEAARSEVASLGPELLVCVAYGKIFGPKFLGLFPRGGVNVHPSLLPKYRGPSPIAAAILAGDSVTGVSIQRLALEMDAGDVLARREIVLDGTETSASLTEQAAELGAALLVKTLAEIEAGSEQAEVQQHGQAEYCGLIKKQDGLLNWGRSAVELHRLVRAFYPWPGAFTMFDGTELKIHKASGPKDLEPTQLPIHNDSAQQPGKVLGVDKRNGILVQTGAGVLALRQLQLSGRKALDWAAFLNGTPNFIGSVLGGTTR
ncbi:MAG: methionyl-tRNA formyltransferase [Spirochaetia bacterium]